MCGLCGMVLSDGEHANIDLLRQMTAALRHRGPDDEGLWCDGVVGLGHRRLSILDLSRAGHQPMKSHDGRYVLVYNGEIYNFRELRRELSSGVVRFRGESDTEVLLEAFARWGEATFRRLNGMFALAVWDSEERLLYLARDRWGIKPLFYAPVGDSLIFGSEIKSLLASGRVARTLDRQGLTEYLWYGVTLGTETFFSAVRHVPPGTYLRFKQGRTTVTRYWSSDEIVPLKPSPGEAVERVRELVEDAVRSHLVSDVPVGIFLSGGLDSSTITAIASRHVEGRLNTYSVGFDFDQGVNELPKARLVAEHFGTDHHEIHVAGADLPKVIEALVESHDVPFGDAANIPLYLLCEQLGGDPKVIIQGDGGDEVFGGYRRYKMLRWERFWRSAAWAAPLLRAAPPSGPRDRMLRILEMMRESQRAVRFALFLTMERREEPPLEILSRDLREQLWELDPFEDYRRRGERFEKLDPAQAMLFTDMEVLLPHQFLEKVDRSTMAHGIETRVPFLDNRLVEYVMALPSSLKLRRGVSKWLLRTAMEPQLPKEIVHGPKTGFGVPYHYWIGGPLASYARSVLLAPEMADLFDRSVLATKLDEHQDGRGRHGFLLWKALNLALWYRRYGVEA